MKPSLNRILVISTTLASLFAVACSTRVQAAEPSTNYVLTVAADRADSIYRQGETVTFPVKVLLDQTPVSDAEV